MTIPALPESQVLAARQKLVLDHFHDKGKARQVSASVREALAHGQISDAILNVLGRGRHDRDKHVQPDAFEALPVSARAGPVDLTRSAATLSRVLDTELRAGKVGLKLEARGLVISLRESGFFASIR